MHTSTKIIGYENNYLIFNNGDVFSLHTNRNLKPATNKQTGYKHVALWQNGVGKSHAIHNLVAEHFVNKIEGKLEVNHIDGVKTNNNWDNLEWVTSSENSFHAVEFGLRVYTNRLTYTEFLECLDDVIHGCSYSDLSKRVPYKVPFLSTKIRRIARETNQEHLLDLSLKQQQKNRARKNIHAYNHR